MKKYQLIKKFAIYSFLAFTLTGIFLSYITFGHIRNDKMENLYEVSKVVIDFALDNSVDFDNLNDLMTESEQSHVKDYINHYLEEYRIKSITILNTELLPILSSNNEYLNFGENTEYNLENLLLNKSRYIISESFSTFDTQNSDTKKFNMIIPLFFSGNQKIIVVLQFPESIISSHALDLVRFIGLSLSGGLLLLFLLLNGILLETSKTLVQQNKRLIQQNIDLESSHKLLDQSYKNTVIAMSNAVDARDEYTAGHSSRVTELSLLIAQKMHIDEHYKKAIEYGTLFHDIGKIGIPDYILNKPTTLTKEEFDLIKSHPSTGTRILQDISFLQDSLPLILHHHERFDGKGYPNNLKGHDIPLGSRIIAIADTFDAMTSDRPYRKALDKEVAIKEIIKYSGTQFDPDIVSVFLKIIQNDSINS